MYSNVESGVPQGSMSAPLFFNIFICDLLFDDIDIYLSTSADDMTPYTYDLENDKVIKLLEKIIQKLFDWFSDNSFKANPDKCHLLINADENVTLKLRMKLLLTVLIKNCLVCYSIIDLISMNMSLHYAGKPPRS